MSVAGSWGAGAAATAHSKHAITIRLFIFVLKLFLWPKLCVELIGSWLEDLCSESKEKIYHKNMDNMNICTGS
jgi:hypothetical protein